jgi:hypothetical protein
VKALSKLADCKRRLGALIDSFESFGDFVTRFKLLHAARAVTDAAE